MTTPDALEGGVETVVVELPFVVMAPPLFAEAELGSCFFSSLKSGFASSTLRWSGWDLTSIMAFDSAIPKLSAIKTTIINFIVLFINNIKIVRQQNWVQLIPY